MSLAYRRIPCRTSWAARATGYRLPLESAGCLRSILAATWERCVCAAICDPCRGKWSVNKELVSLIGVFFVLFSFWCRYANHRLSENTTTKSRAKLVTVLIALITMSVAFVFTIKCYSHGFARLIIRHERTFKSNKTLYRRSELVRTLWIYYRSQTRAGPTLAHIHKKSKTKIPMTLTLLLSFSLRNGLNSAKTMLKM